MNCQVGWFIPTEVVEKSTMVYHIGVNIDGIDYYIELNREVEN